MPTKRLRSKAASVMGKTTLARHGREHYRALGKKYGKLGGKPRKYPPCPKAPAKRKGIHQWNPQGKCWYCGHDRSKTL